MIRISTCFAAVLLSTPLLMAGIAFQPSLAQAPAGGTVVLTGARLIDGTGRAPLEQATLVISNGRIEAVGAPAAVKPPAGAVRIDLSGKTIMPGLISAHAHANADAESTQPVRDQLARQLRVYADYGVTTAFLLDAAEPDLPHAITLRDEQEHGRLDRARVYVTGPSVRVAKTTDEARKAADSRADAKVNIVKMHINGNANDMTPEVYGALIDQAHKRGLTAAAHLYFLKDAKGLVDAGIDVIAHSVRDQDVDAAFITELKRRNVGYIATLTRELSVFTYETTPAFFSDPFFLRHVDAYRKQMTLLSDPALQEKTRNSKEAQAIKQALQQASRNLKLLSDAGAAIAMGTDSGAPVGRWQGYFEHTELELMVKAGMTPMQALVAATGGAARVMKLDRQLGTIQAGKWADLLVLNADPVSDIRHTRQIESVWIAGRRLSDVPKSPNQ
jgi:imidazolonepropionase-like amidohydrolase